MRLKLVNVGFGNMVSCERIVAIVGAGALIDATYGRRTRAVLIMDSGHIILSALQPETVSARTNGRETEDSEAEEVGEDG